MYLHNFINQRFLISKFRRTDWRCYSESEGFGIVLQSIGHCCPVRRSDLDIFCRFLHLSTLEHVRSSDRPPSSIATAFRPATIHAQPPGVPAFPVACSQRIGKSSGGSGGGFE